MTHGNGFGAPGYAVQESLLTGGADLSIPPIDDKRLNYPCELRRCK